jgi:hypothetical protein
MRFTLIAISVTLIVSACGPAYHLRRAAHHIDRAKAKGALISRDTVTVHDTTLIKSHTVDTLFQDVNFYDTLVVEDTRTITKVKVNYVDRKVYIKTFVKPDTVYKEIKIPCETLRVPIPLYRDPWVIPLIVFAIILLLIIRSYLR